MKKVGFKMRCLAVRLGIKIKIVNFFRRISCARISKDEVSHKFFLKNCDKSVKSYKLNTKFQLNLKDSTHKMPH